MSEETAGAAIVDRIMGVVDENIDAYYSRGSRDFVVGEVSSIVAAALAEKGAEIARLKEGHHAVCSGMAESILIIVRKLADRDAEIAGLKAKVLQDAQIIDGLHSRVIDL